MLLLRLADCTAEIPYVMCRVAADTWYADTENPFLGYRKRIARGPWAEPEVLPRQPSFENEQEVRGLSQRDRGGPGGSRG